MNKTIASGMRHSPMTDATAPGIPRILVPVNTAMLTWLAPGRIRHMVMADRNSSSPIHFFSTTIISRDHADNPPPNDANAMWLNVHASSSRETSSECWSSDFRAGASLMHEFGVVREVVLVMLGRIERVGWVVLVRESPVLVEDDLEPGDHGRVRGRDAQFAPQ